MSCQKLKYHSLSLSLSLSQTIDFELRKLEAQQASEHVNLLLSFMPNSFLVSGGACIPIT